MNKIQGYLQDVVKEMRKVNWPSQEELASSTFITIIATIIVSLFIFAADQAISTVLEILVYSVG